MHTLAWPHLGRTRKLVFPGRAGYRVLLYVLGARGGADHGTQTRGGSIARERVDSFSRGGSHTVPLSRVMPDAALRFAFVLACRAE